MKKNEHKTVNWILVLVYHISILSNKIYCDHYGVDIINACGLTLNILSFRIITYLAIDGGYKIIKNESSFTVKNLNIKTSNANIIGVYCVLYRIKYILVIE